MTVDPYLSGAARPYPEPARCPHGIPAVPPAEWWVWFGSPCQCCGQPFVAKSQADAYVGRCAQCR